MQLTGRKEEHGGWRGAFSRARPRRGICLFPSHSTSFDSKNRTKHTVPHNTKPNYFSLVLLTFPVLSHSSFCCPDSQAGVVSVFLPFLYTHPATSGFRFLALLKGVSDLLIVKIQASRFPFDPPSLYPSPSVRSHSQGVI